MIAHCLFEQSGTFKNEFKNLGIEAYDYDILNEFGETDYIVDLFSEIGGAYEGKPSIFDSIKEEDLIMAFFPCTRFETKIIMCMKCEASEQRKWNDEKKLEYAMKLHKEMDAMYQCISKLAVVCLRKNLRLVIENPKSIPHHLSDYWCLKPKLIDKDRTLNGDYYKKPTQYWFINCEPKQNLVFEPLEYVETKTIERERNAVKRSLMHPQYANRFIRQYLI